MVYIKVQFIQEDGDEEGLRRESDGKRDSDIFDWRLLAVLPKCLLRECPLLSEPISLLFSLPPPSPALAPWPHPPAPSCIERSGESNPPIYCLSGGGDIEPSGSFRC